MRFHEVGSCLHSFFFVFASAPAAFAQGVKSGPDPSTLRDPDLERDSLHNLEVAKTTSS